jgi:hypothetical protein
MATIEEKARWYDEIAPRRTNFGNDLPGGIVARGVDVLNALRDWKCKAAVSADDERLLNFTADDVACFLMCVDEFWERHNANDIARRLEERAAHSAGDGRG